MFIEVAAGAAALAATAFGIRWYRKAKDDWRVIAEGSVRSIRHEKWDHVIGADPYTYDDQIQAMTDTVIVFEEGEVLRLAGEHHRSGSGPHLKVLENGLGHYKLE